MYLEITHLSKKILDGSVNSRHTLTSFCYWQLLTRGILILPNFCVRKSKLMWMSKLGLVNLLFIEHAIETGLWLLSTFWKRWNVILRSWKPILMAFILHQCMTALLRTGTYVQIYFFNMEPKLTFQALEKTKV